MCVCVFVFYFVLRLTLDSSSESSAAPRWLDSTGSLQKCTNGWAGERERDWGRVQRGRRGRRVHLTASISFAAIVSFMIFDPCLIMIFDTKPAPPRRYDIFLARLSWGEAPSQNPAVDGHITHDCTRTVSSVGTSRTMAVLVRAARTVLSFLVLFIHFQLSPPLFPLRPVSHQL